MQGVIASSEVTREALDVSLPKGERRRPLEQRGGLPPWAYDNAELTALEKELVFRRNWLLVGHVGQIPKVGDYMTLDVADERALVVRGEDGAVRAFHNLCRHRGSRVVAEPKGNCGRVITCPFHGWCYELSGRLRGVPRPKTFPKLDRDQYGLKPLDCEIWHGFVFVRFKGSGPSMAEILAPVEADFAARPMADLRTYDEAWSYEFELDWKAALDVDNEGYHVPVAHPSLQDLYGHSYRDNILSDKLNLSIGDFGDKPASLWSVRHYMKALPEMSELPADQRRSWRYYGIFPNLVITLFPDMVDFYQFFPIDSRRSVMRGGYLALPDSRREIRLSRYLLQRINRMTGDEDIQLIKWAWEGYRSSAFEDIMLSDDEQVVRAYHDRLRDVLPVLNLREAPAPGTIAETNRRLSGAAV